MGCCCSETYVRYCENSVSTYNSKEIQEILSPDGSVQVLSRPNRTWKGSNRYGQSEKIVISFPMLNSKISRIILSFSYFVKGVITKYGPEEPNLYLEVLSLTGEISSQEIALSAIKSQSHTMNLQMEASDTPIIANAEPGDIFRLKVSLPRNNKIFIVKDLIATFFPQTVGVPAVRLSFEEFVEMQPGRQIYEIKSYRAWYLRHKLSILGWVNTPPLLHCPQSIEVSMKVDVMKDPRVNGVSNLDNLRYRFELQMVHDRKVIASIPLLSNSAATVNFHVTNDSIDAKIRNLFQVFRPGYQIQIAREIYYIAGSSKTHLVRVTCFSLKLQSSNNSPFANTFSHLSKAEALHVFPRTTDPLNEEEAVSFYYDPYTSNNTLDGDGNLDTHDTAMGMDPYGDEGAGGDVGEGFGGK